MIGKKPGLGPDNGEATSTIGENSSFDGSIEVNGNLRVDGPAQFGQELIPIGRGLAARRTP